MGSPHFLRALHLRRSSTDKRATQLLSKIVSSGKARHVTKKDISEARRRLEVQPENGNDPIRERPSPPSRDLTLVVQRNSRS